jgi:peroxiredoxin
VQLQSAKERFEKQGIKLGAISYDSPAILKDFAERHKIEYPLLADPESKIIASYGVLNTAASGMQKWRCPDTSASVRTGSSGRNISKRNT